MYEHKQEILSSRVGCLGASDSNLIATVASNGIIPKSAYKRLAIVKGLIEPNDNIKTDAMQLGDDIEMTIFENLKKTDDRWQSNYRLESKKYSKPNVKLIAHIDFFLKDDENKVLKLVECKATKSTTFETQMNYKNQIFTQYILGRELANSLGSTWKVQVSLCHYCTAQHLEFDPQNITFKRIKFTAPAFDINKGMTLIDNFLETFDEYYEGDEIDADLLPENVKSQFDLVAQTIREIEEKEKQVEEFKERLYEFLLERNIKSVKNDVFAITLVEPSISESFDHKSFLADYATEHPLLCKRLRAKYNRKSNRKGYVKINVKKPKL